MERSCFPSTDCFPLLGVSQWCELSHGGLGERGRAAFGGPFMCEPEQR